MYLSNHGVPKGAVDLILSDLLPVENSANVFSDRPSRCLLSLRILQLSWPVMPGERKPAGQLKTCRSSYWLNATPLKEATPTAGDVATCVRSP